MTETMRANLYSLFERLTQELQGADAASAGALLPPFADIAAYSAVSVATVQEATQTLTVLGRAWKRGQLSGVGYSLGCDETLRRVGEMTGGRGAYARQILSDESGEAAHALSVQARFERATWNAATIAAADGLLQLRGGARVFSRGRRAVVKVRREALREIERVMGPPEGTPEP